MNAAKARFFASPLARLPKVARLPRRNPEKAGIIANDTIADLLVTQLCPKDGTFIDIGAQYGAVFASALRHDPSIYVIAFEADAGKAEVLRRVHLGVLIFGVAAGETPGKAKFHINTKASGFNSLVPSTGEHIKEASVDVVRLDDVVHDSQPDVIKIDVEGAELGVLRGATKLIARTRPTIMFECVMRGTNALGYSAEALWDWFTQMNYAVYTPNRVAHTAPALTLEAFLDAQQYPFASHNYFAIPKERTEQVRNDARSILGIHAA